MQCWMHWTIVVGLFGCALPAVAAEPVAKQFAQPGAEWRGKPFWSWNGELKEDELIRQIDVLRQMGMGGFFMHSRTGLVTEYLGDEWFRLINACADEGKRQHLQAWLYDEDRWPSGTAGGMVTENPALRERFMTMRTAAAADFRWSDDLTAAFACKLDGVNISECRRIAKDTPAADIAGKTVLAFFVEEMQKSPFYNGYTYVDTLNRDATDLFIKLTHEKYRVRCGDRLGDSIQGIFLDEPHRGSVFSNFGKTNPLPAVPWTAALPAKFQERFGVDIVDRLPELFLRPEGKTVLPIKWQYMELTQQMFLDNFAKPVHDWCKANKMEATGHVLHEDSLTSQAVMQGSLMRYYEYLDVPGVDVLTEGNRNYWIVKQLASASRQIGRKWMLSELYGCTGWQMPFEGHKAVGDWQALFGINVRCHHLSWYTMGGEAKRDYPASIFYQSAWWKDYSYVEDYFARIGLVLSQGAPQCDILVVNPIESVWCQVYNGFADGLGARDPAVQRLEQQYQEMFFWLTRAHLDFDYGDEDMIARLYRVEKDAQGAAVLWIGKAPYKAVVVGGMTTLRGTTKKALEQFATAGGKVIFAGDPPAYVDAVASNEPAALAARCVKTPWDAAAVAAECGKAVRPRATVLDGQTGQPLGEVFCQTRLAGDVKYVVAMNVNTQSWFRGAKVRIPGASHVAEWDCRTGNRYTVDAKVAHGALEFTTDFPPSGERVFAVTQEKDTAAQVRSVLVDKAQRELRGPFAYRLSEKNVCVLDLARFQVAAQPWQDETEVLKIDLAARQAFGLEPRGGEMVQPWFKKKQHPVAEVKGPLKMEFAFSVDEMPEKGVELCLEQPERFRLKLNGEPIASKPEGWWIDPVIRRVAVAPGALKQGKNLLQVETDFREDTNIEALYLIGNFGVRLTGTQKTLGKLPEKLESSDLTAQGLPFYSGEVTYVLPIEKRAADAGRAALVLPKFEGACAKVVTPGQPQRMIAWQPFEADITADAAAGKVELSVVLTRRNTFGPLHQIPLRDGAYGPGNWTTGGPAWSQNYMLYPAGLLAAPVVVER